MGKQYDIFWKFSLCLADSMYFKELIIYSSPLELSSINIERKN
jgi:hypothetical protein